MHSSVMNFLQEARNIISKDQKISNLSIIEIGSFNVNGSARTIFHDAHYLGLDMREGPGVDRKFNITSDPIPNEWIGFFNIVICVNTLEHCFFWKQALNIIKTLLCEKGYMLFSVPSVGMPKHDFPDDFWRFSLNDIQQMFSEFHCIKIIPDPELPGVIGMWQKPETFIYPYNINENS